MLLCLSPNFRQQNNTRPLPIIVILFNHNDLDHITLYRGGGYIVEDGNMLKPCESHFPPGYHNYHHHLYPLKNLKKNDIHVNSRDVSDTTNPFTSLLSSLLLYKVSFVVVASKGVPLYHSSITKVAITSPLSTQLI